MSDLFEKNIVGKVATETVKAFAQVFGAYLDDSAKETAASRLADAQSELRRQLEALATSTETDGWRAQESAQQKINDDLDAVFEGDPWWHAYVSDGDDDRIEAQVADRIIVDPTSVDLSQPVYTKLWSTFTPLLIQAGQRLQWAEMDTNERLEWLNAHTSDDARIEALHRIGSEDVQAWMQMYHTFYGS